MKLTDSQIAEIEDWIEYFRLEHAGLMVSPPIDDPAVIKEWELKLQSLVVKPKAIPFATSVIPQQITEIPTIKRSRKQTKKANTVSGLSPKQYEMQQENNFPQVSMI